MCKNIFLVLYDAGARVFSVQQSHRLSAPGYQDNVNIHRGQECGPAQPQHRAQLSASAVRTRHETLTRSR